MLSIIFQIIAITQCPISHPNLVLVTSHQIGHSGKGPKPTSKQNDKNTHSNEQKSESSDVVTPKTPIVNTKKFDIKRSVYQRGDNQIR